MPVFIALLSLLAGEISRKMSQHYRSILKTRSPGGGGGGVAKAPQRVLGGLGLLGGQLQAGFQLVDDASAAGVQQEVLKGPAEVGDI